MIRRGRSLVVVEKKEAAAALEYVKRKDGCVYTCMYCSWAKEEEKWGTQIEFEYDVLFARRQRGNV